MILKEVHDCHTVGIPCETFPGERRVALTPKACDTLIEAKLKVILEYSARTRGRLHR